MSAGVSESADGRLARRDRNRTAVLDAMIELFTEGVLEPTPEQVAQRVGLSPRSVYRYFADRESLIRAAIDRHLDGVWHLYLIPAIGQGDTEDRIVRFIGCRIQLYEAIAASARATRMSAATDEIMREQLEATRRALRDQIERHFAPELDAMPAATRRGRVAAIDALCELESLDHYRIHRGFSSTDTHSLLLDALRALLDH